jgi:DNA-binding NarL/FixJ family response regulator
MTDVWIMAPSAGRRELLCRCCSEADIHVAGVASTFPFLRSLMSEAQADLALIELPIEMQPSTVKSWLSEFAELVPVVLLSQEGDPSLLKRVTRGGSGGLLQSNAPCEQIVQAIKSVASGLTVFDGALVSQSGEETAPEHLTPREAEVLQLLADGLANKDIAARLNISEHTIKFHIRSILGKLGVASRTEAVARGLRSGLIEL